LAAKPYALLVQAMEASNKVAIAKFVMRSKQYLAALRPKDGTLLLSMMVYADELTGTGEISEFEDVASVKIEKKELAMADQLIASLSEAFDPAMFHDTYREQVLELIDRKAGGEQIVAQVTAPPSADKVIDLMAALEASVKAAKGARGRHPTALASVDGVDAGEDMGEDIDEDESSTKPARKAAARKTPAKKVAAKAAPAKPDAAKRTRKSA
jgi:DNA end-binding protein Ku